MAKTLVGTLTILVFSVGWSRMALAENSKLQFAAMVGDLLKPEKWFEVLKKNITIPVLDEEINIPTPTKTLEDASSTLRDINKDILEETGIDFAKFFSWIAKVLKVFFQIIINLIETISKTLSG